MHISYRPGGGRFEDSGVFLRSRSYRSPDRAYLKCRLQYWPLFLFLCHSKILGSFQSWLSLLSFCPCSFHLSVLAVIAVSGCFLFLPSTSRPLALFMCHPLRLSLNSFSSTSAPGVHCSCGYSFFSQNEEDSVSCSNPLSRLALETDLGSDANGVRDGD